MNAMLWSAQVLLATVFLYSSFTKGLVARTAAGGRADGRPLAALGLAMVMIGAAAMHITQNEPRVAMLNIGLLLLAAFVCVGRIAYVA